MGIVSAAFLLTTLGTALAIRALGPRAPRAALIQASSVVFIFSVAPGWQATLPFWVLALAGFAAIRLAPGATGLAPLWLLLAGIVASWWLLRHAWPPALAAGAALGLSYAMFRILHLVVDARDGQLGTPLTFHGYLAYLAFFPSHLAGPVQRYQHFAPQLANPAPPASRADWLAAGQRSLAGLAKCTAVAGLFWEAHRASLAALDPAPAGLGSVFLLAAAALAYAGWLYAGFSGYMDLAVSAGRLLGIQVPENFNHPLRARSFLDLWSRWHITLSDWFRFYVFNPVVKALLEALPQPTIAPYLGALGYFLAFFLMGLWHGQTMALVLYGLALGAGVSVNKAWQVLLVQRLGRPRTAALGARPAYRFAARTLGLAYFVAALAFLWLPAPFFAASEAMPLLGATIVLAVACGGLAFLSGHGHGDAEAPRPLPAPAAWALALAQAAAVAAYTALDGEVPSLLYEQL